MPMVYKEIKRGGMHCEVWERKGVYTYELTYRRETRKSIPFTDEDECVQKMTEAAETWIEEMIGRSNQTSGMKMTPRKP